MQLHFIFDYSDSKYFIFYREFLLENPLPTPYNFKVFAFLDMLN